MHTPVPQGNTLRTLLDKDQQGRGPAPFSVTFPKAPYQLLSLLNKYLDSLNCTREDSDGNGLESSLEIHIFKKFPKQNDDQPSLGMVTLIFIVFPFFFFLPKDTYIQK